LGLRDDDARPCARAGHGHSLHRRCRSGGGADESGDRGGDRRPRSLRDHPQRGRADELGPPVGSRNSSARGGVKGHSWVHDGDAQSEGKVHPLAHWEMIAIDAVGNVIEFWGFKRNQGRVWALLYLRDETLSAATIEKQLALSKGGVSMLLRDLERWGVLRRVRAPGEAAWRYRAETELVRMVTRVVEHRE